VVSTPPRASGGPAWAGKAPVPLRQSRWPVPRTPRWLLLALVVLVAAGVAVAWPHRPSTAERATDLHEFLTSMRSGIESCAGGVSESLYALHAIAAGSSHDTHTALGIASYGAANCSPANNQSLDDLTQYQVSESLASYHLDTAVNDLVTWAFPLAQRVQNDVVGILSAHSAGARSSETAALRRDEQALDSERSRIDGIIGPAIKALSAHDSLPNLPR
jgi:hypothetical protein